MVINKELKLPYCVILEVCTILTNKADKKLADQFLQDVLDSDNIAVINDDVTSGINHFLSTSERLSFTDISLLLLSDQLNAELITFDEQLLKLYKKVKTL